MSEELEDLASHVASFVNERCMLGPEYEISVDALYLEWKQWCIDKGVRYFLEQNHFSQKVRSKFHVVTRGRPRRGKPGRPTWLTGVGLREIGG